MTQKLQRGFALTLAVLLALPLPAQQGAPQGQGNPDQGAYVLRTESDLVLTNVVARDAKTGQVVLGLKQSDFTILENGKPQQISDFDFESVDMAKPLNEVTISGLASSARGKTATSGTRAEDLKDHRLIVLFFDLTSMQPMRERFDNGMARILGSSSGPFK